MINSSFGGFHALILGGEWSLSDSPGVRRLRFWESFMPSNTLWHGFPMETQLRICKIVQNGPDLQSWVKKMPACLNFHLLEVPASASCRFHKAAVSIKIDGNFRYLAVTYLHNSVDFDTFKGFLW